MRLRLALLLAGGTVAVVGCLGIGLTDAGPPSIIITSPAGPTVSGNVDFAADAVDDVAVVKVVFSVGNQVLFEDTASPWTTQWNTVPTTNGPVTLKAQAFDAVGNSGTASRVVTVSNIPN
jgi:hypothetical protein